MLAGVLITLLPNLRLIIPGILLLTFGFFGAHSIASSWVSKRAKVARAQASSLYLFFLLRGFEYCKYPERLLLAPLVLAGGGPVHCLPAGSGPDSRLAP